MTNKTLTASRAWQDLNNHFERIKKTTIKEHFLADPDRAKKFVIADQEIYFDFSKNRINSKTVELLLNLTKSVGLKSEIEAMFTGQKINRTENRAVLHTSLRDFSNTPVMVDGEDIKAVVKKTLKKMRSISDRIRKGEWQGYSGKAIKNVINIGVGGSDLGPRMVTSTLQFYSQRDIKLYFVSNIDATDISETLRDLEPEETLFIISSKTFTTLETITNAATAREWLLKKSASVNAASPHFLAVTSNRNAAREFGVNDNNILEFRDWVGGRYSLTSAIGISIMISLGYDNFIRLLKGFNSMDNHFRYKEFNQNIPVILGLLGIWYNNFFKSQTWAIIPYDQYLAKLPSYLQQADMESNGKCTDRNGNPVAYETGPVIWGESGTNGQHAFFQLIHQGNKLIPGDFIGFANSLNETGDHHTKLMANFFAQTRALAFGKSEEELVKEGVARELVPYKVMPGNRPSNTILIDKLTPYSLGRLIAIYEHKIFVQGVIWNIYSFDQWGVELGKVLAKKIRPDLSQKTGQYPDYDCSTRGLIEHFHQVKEIK